MDSRTLNARLPYATDSELEIITRLCRPLKHSDQMVIIGAGPGVMLLAAREGGLGFHISIVDIDGCHFASRHLEQAGLNHNVEYIRADSVKRGREWVYPRGQVHFLIVDGDHSYAAVKADLDAWLPHIAFGGVVMLHDYDSSGTGLTPQPGVKLAVDEVLDGNPEYAPSMAVGTSRIFTRLKML